MKGILIQALKTFLKNRTEKNTFGGKHGFHTF